mmetsp:Transcript_1507/g.9262  ORF Transcript_1507/g.9262 Transcript_1507/m.9262 type:complete len:622 (-) Transcript_1507:158-2023(-)
MSQGPPAFALWRNKLHGSALQQDLRQLLAGEQVHGRGHDPSGLRADRPGRGHAGEELVVLRRGRVPRLQIGTGEDDASRRPTPIWEGKGHEEVGGGAHPAPHDPGEHSGRGIASSGQSIPKRHHLPSREPGPCWGLPPWEASADPQVLGSGEARQRREEAIQGRDRCDGRVLHDRARGRARGRDLRGAHAGTRGDRQDARERESRNHFDQGGAGENLPVEAHHRKRFEENPKPGPIAHPEVRAGPHSSGHAGDPTSSARRRMGDRGGKARLVLLCLPGSGEQLLGHGRGCGGLPSSYSLQPHVHFGSCMPTSGIRVGRFRFLPFQPRSTNLPGLAGPSCILDLFTRAVSWCLFSAASRQGVDERIFEFGEYALGGHVSELEDAFDDGDFRGGGVQSTESRPIVGHQSCAHHIAPSIDGACHEGYLQQGGEFVHVFEGRFGMHDAAFVGEPAVGAGEYFARDGLSEHFDAQHVGHEFFGFTIHVGMDECDVIVACDAVSQRREPFVDPLHHHVFRQGVPHVHQLLIRGGVGHQQPVFVSHGQPAHQSRAGHRRLHHRHVLAQLSFEGAVSRARDRVSRSFLHVLVCLLARFRRPRHVFVRRRSEPTCRTFRIRLGPAARNDW